MYVQFVLKTDYISITLFTKLENWNILIVLPGVTAFQVILVEFLFVVYMISVNYK